jgi:hypothetical protein
MASKLQLELIYHDIARRLIMKQPLEDIARAIGVKESSVKRALRNTVFQDILKQVTERSYLKLDSQIQDAKANIRERIEDAAQKSLGKLLFLLENAASESVQLNAAMTLLDRGGYSNKMQVEQTQHVMFDSLTGSVIMDALNKEAVAKASARPLTEFIKKPEELDHPIITHLKASSENSEPVQVQGQDGNPVKPS